MVSLVQGQRPYIKRKQKKLGQFFCVSSLTLTPDIFVELIRKLIFIPSPWYIAEVELVFGLSATYSDLLKQTSSALLPANFSLTINVK